MTLVEDIFGAAAASQPQPAPQVGDRVRIERVETLYPPEGTWPLFRGRTATVVEINTDHKRPHLTEYGVVFGKLRTPNPKGSISDGAPFWFKLYELRPITGAAPESHAHGTTTPADSQIRRRPVRR